jgi:hypothetical protein
MKASGRYLLLISCAAEVFGPSSLMAVLVLLSRKTYASRLLPGKRI